MSDSHIEDAPPGPGRPARTWSGGLALISFATILSLMMIFDHPPVWVRISGLALAVVLVAVGVTLLRTRAAGWRPSDTLPDPGDEQR